MPRRPASIRSPRCAPERGAIRGIRPRALGRPELVLRRPLPPSRLREPGCPGSTRRRGYEEGVSPSLRPSMDRVRPLEQGRASTTRRHRLKPRRGLPMPRSRRNRLTPPPWSTASANPVRQVYWMSRAGERHRDSGPRRWQCLPPVLALTGLPPFLAWNRGGDRFRRPGTRERRRSDRVRDVPVSPFGRTRPPLGPRPGAARRTRRRHLRHRCRSGIALVVCFVGDRGRLGRRRGTGRTGVIRRGERQHLGERLRTVLGRVPARDRYRGRHVPGCLRPRLTTTVRGTHVVTVPDWPDRPARESTAGTYAWVSAYGGIPP